MPSYENADPPEDPAEGWKPDPLGSNKVRYWDGSAWTERVGTVQPQKPQAANLNDAPAPHDPASGYKPDPLGSASERFWDGSKWTGRIRHSGDPTTSQPGWWSRQSKSLKLAIIIGGILLAIAGLTSIGEDSSDTPSTPAESAPEKVIAAPEASGGSGGGDQGQGGSGGGNSGQGGSGGSAPPSSPSSEADKQEESGKVEVKVLGVRENPPLPDWVSDDTFNDNQTVIGIKVKVTNNTGKVQVPDFYLKGADDNSGYDDYPPGTSSLTATELDAGESFSEELLFGMLSWELPAKELVVIEPFDDKVLFTQKLN